MMTLNNTIIKAGDKVLITKKSDTFYKYIGRIMANPNNEKFRVDLKYIIREYEREDFQHLREGDSYGQ